MTENFTQDLSLASALCSVGIPLAPPYTVRTTTYRGDSFTFYFESASACGEYKFAELAKAWHDDSWHEANPEHPFAYVKCAFKNREALLDKVKGGESLVVVERNGKLAILSSNASEETKRAIFSF